MPNMPRRRRAGTNKPLDNPATVAEATKLMERLKPLQKNFQRLGSELVYVADLRREMDRGLFDDNIRVIIADYRESERERIYPDRKEYEALVRNWPQLEQALLTSLRQLWRRLEQLWVQYLYLNDQKVSAHARDASKFEAEDDREFTGKKSIERLERQLIRVRNQVYAVEAMKMAMDKQRDPAELAHVIAAERAGENEPTKEDLPDKADALEIYQDWDRFARDVTRTLRQGTRLIQRQFLGYLWEFSAIPRPTPPPATLLLGSS